MQDDRLLLTKKTDKAPFFATVEKLSLKVAVKDILNISIPQII